MLRAEVQEAFRTPGAPDETALRAAVSVSAAMAKVEGAAGRGFSRRDAAIDAIREDVGAVERDRAGVESEPALHGRMLGFVLATDTAIVFELFGH